MTAWTRPRIVVLCGSTRFVEVFNEANIRETAAGRIVLTVGCNLKEPHPLWDTTDKADQLKSALDELHRAKIRLADEVLVINVGDYLGESTRREIAFAESLGKPVRYWVPRGPVL